MTAAVAGLATFGFTACEPVPPGAAPNPPGGEPGSWVGTRSFPVGHGGYCWFQGTRAEFSPGTSKLWIGTSSSNQKNPKNDGNVIVRSVDMKARRVTSETVIGKGAVDDHTAASILALADGSVIAGWTSRKKEPWFEVGKVGQPMTRIKRPNSEVTRGGQGCSYAATFEVGKELWVLYRGEQWLWNLMRSPDGGKSWFYAGIVVAPSKPVPYLVDDKMMPAPKVGHRPYLQGVVHRGSLHILVTDAHPSVLPGCSVYAMIVRPDLAVTNSAGDVIGEVGSAPPLPASGTPVLSGNVGGTEGRAWLCDLAVSNKEPTAVLSVRKGATHHYWLSRRGSNGMWRNEYLCSGGTHLYAAEKDYSGLGTVDRSSHRRVVVSTNVSPITGEKLVSRSDKKIHWELWEGRGAGVGQWTWTPITSNSISDQIRPVIANSSNGAKALVWMSGTYRSYKDFDTQIMVAQAY